MTDPERPFDLGSPAPLGDPPWWHDERHAPRRAASVPVPPQPTGEPGPAVMATTVVDEAVGLRAGPLWPAKPVAELAGDPTLLSGPTWRQPRARGFAGPGRGGTSQVVVPPEWRGTSFQVCGLWPFGVGTSTPMVGVPIGRHLITHATVCCDPIAWFQAGLVPNPSAFVLGRPGLGKSSLVRRMCLGLIARKVVPMVLGDLKPDYADLVEAVGGQVVRIGQAGASLNPLDPGGMRLALPLLPERQRNDLSSALLGFQRVVVSALVELARRQRLRDYEEAALTAAIRLVNERHTDRAPTLRDLITVMTEGPERVREAVYDRGDRDRYNQLVEDLQRSLTSLISGTFGEVFTEDAAVEAAPLQLDAPAVCLDISAILHTDQRVKSAVLLACWSHGFGAIRARQLLAEAGLAPEPNFFAVLDELWQLLGGGDSMVDRLDALTRLNRQQGLGQIMITHSMKDLDSLPTEDQRAKARGFAERASIIAMAGLPPGEIGSLAAVLDNPSQAEMGMVTEWATPEGWDITRDPPGLGKFLLKVGSRAGVPVKVQLTRSEVALHNTNKRWAMG